MCSTSWRNGATARNHPPVAEPTRSGSGDCAGFGWNVAGQGVPASGEVGALVVEQFADDADRLDEVSDALSRRAQFEPIARCSLICQPAPRPRTRPLLIWSTVTTRLASTTG